MFPINLVLFQMMSDVRYEIKRNFITLLSDLKLLTLKNSGSSVLNELTVTNWSWLIRLKKMLKIRPQTDPPNFWRCDLKKMEEY